MKISPDKRYFIHQIPKLTANHSDYIEVSESGKCQISPSFKIKISEGTEKLLSLFESNLENGTDWTDGSVYTGLAGYAYLYYLMETKPKISGALEVAKMKISPDKRYFIHQIPKLTANHSAYIEVSESGKCQISPSFKIKISEGTEKLLSLFESNLENGTDWTDGSVYTGLAGYAYLYYLMETKPKISGALETARKYVERSVGLCRGKYLPFLTGDAGPFTLGAIIYHRLGDTQKSEFYIGKLKELANSHHVDKIGTKLPDEILYGRAGYLSALLLAREEIDNHVIEDSLIKQVVSSMIASGEDLAKKHPELGAPLMYKWHDSYYLGGAHGLTGILLFLLKDSSFQIRPCLAFVKLARTHCSMVSIQYHF
ncbi:glutathione S-transferase LANCL1-like isoform X3 [Artemia franciscana]